MIKILITPDSFKGTHDAGAVAAAIGRGVERGSAAADLLPVADGGDGTARVLMEALGGDAHSASVSGPLGEELDAEFVLLADGRTAAVDVASASGLARLTPEQFDPLETTTYGTGELIYKAIEAGASEVIVGAGGSATVDGGTGAIKAIERHGGVGRTKLIVLCDTQTPFELAAATFGPQKGADSAAVKTLDQRLAREAKKLPRDPRGRAMTGAAGGLSGGLWSQYAAKLMPGAQFVLDRSGFAERMRDATAVVTGEGQLDNSTLTGKLVSEIATRARQGGVPCHAIVGASELDPFGIRMLDLETVQVASNLKQLEIAGERLANSLAKATK